MLVTKTQQAKIEERFEVVKAKAKGREDALFGILKECNEDELICMKYLYAFMPDQDLANYEGELFLKFVRHALKIRKIVPWGEHLTGELFLNYVLQYRVNNENIEFYKEAFSDELLPRVQNMSMEEAALEVNYWCFEKATYQSTDIRTASPFTVLRNTYGRCGEESTLAVSALRSIGLPARQIYAPRWAHCDDNHAWAEVWIDGKWHFLGACEPDAKLDTGWFMLPASKGMLIHNKVLSHFNENEVVTYQKEGWSEINVLERYADTKWITIKVKDSKGQPVTNANVRFELLNYSELFPLAELKTDSKGEVHFLTGLGDLMICAVSEGVHVYEKMDVRLMDRLELTLPETFEMEVDSKLTLIPPEGRVPSELILTEEEKAIHDQKHSEALRIRNAFKETFYDGDKALIYAKAYAPFEKEVAQALEKALGNANEIIAFIEDEETKEYLEDKIHLLSTLSKKDFTDSTAKCLKAHLVEAVVYKDLYEKEIFVPYLLAPRITFEMLSDYRSPLKARLEEALQEKFKADPAQIYNYILEHMGASEECKYSTFYSEPVGLWDLKVGSMLSKKVLFVALCRTLGIPAKFNQADESVAFYKDGAWIYLTDKGSVRQTGTLILEKEDLSLEFDYFRNFTVGKLKKGVYTTLDLEGETFQEKELSYTVEPGHYRIITSNRQADGTLLVRLYYVDVEENQTSKVCIGITQEIGEMTAVEVVDHEIQTLDGKALKLSDVIETKRNIIAYIEVAAEPTEHLLNEIIESQEKFNSNKPNIVLILKDSKDFNDPTLQKALKAVPHIKIYVGHDIESIDTIYNGFNIQDKKLPLAYVMNEAMKAHYAWAGYNVGIGELLLKYTI